MAKKPERSRSAKTGRKRREETRATWWLGGILVFAAAVRIAYLLFFRANDPLFDQLLHDSKVYQDWAAALARGEAWETGVFYHAPLYPYLVGLLYRVVGPLPIAVYLVQMAAGLCVISMIHRIGTRTYGAFAGLAGGVLAALYGVYPFYETKLLPASLAVLAVCFLIDRMQAADAADSDGGWLLAGVVVGLGALLRPNLLLLAPLAVVWIARDRSRSPRRRIRRAGFCLLGAAVVIAPVAARNFRVAGDPVLISSNGGITFYQGNNPEAWGLFSAPEGMSGSIFKQREESRAIAEARVGHPLRDSEVSGYWFRQGLEFIGRHPGEYLLLEGRKAVLALDNYEHALEYNPQIDPNPIRWIVPVPFALILGLAAARAFAGRRYSRRETPIFFLLAAQAATLLLFYAAGRYRLPATGALIVVAGAGASTLWERWRSGGTRLWVPLLVSALVAAFSFVPWPVAGPGNYRIQRATALADRGSAYLSAGRTAEAVAAYRKSIELNPGDAYAHLDLGKALGRDGDSDGAEGALREAIDLAPELAEAHYDLGALLYDASRFEEAADEFDAAFRLDPENGDAGNNLIGTCIRIGRREAAVDASRRMIERGLTVDPPLLKWLSENVLEKPGDPSARR